MNDVTTLRIDLGIQAQQIASQIMVNNNNIEKNIANGIQKAIDELSSEQAFEQAVSMATKKAILDIVDSTILGWEFRNKVKKIVDEKISGAIGVYGEKLAEKMIQTLESHEPTRD